jgi:antagonist of KipI
MGLRLRGAPLTVPQRELVSEPVCPGTVQVTRDGQCIVLGVDGQTIGGYPKVGQIIAADLDRLGQLRPSEEVNFLPVGLEEAQQLYRERQAALREWIHRLQAGDSLVGS